MPKDRHDDGRDRTPNSTQARRPAAAGLSGIGSLGDDEEETVADPELQRRLAGNTRRDTVGPFAVPAGWGFHELSLLDFWTRVLDLQRAQMDGPEALGLALSAYDLESFAHLDWIRERFDRRYRKDPDYEKARLEALQVRSARASRKA
ncbi:MAG TPA: hypothetical protein VGK67_29255 [Myxococcales bacterium]|jgi:hypothetical protein